MKMKTERPILTKLQVETLRLLAQQPITPIKEAVLFSPGNAASLASLAYLGLADVDDQRVYTISDAGTFELLRRDAQPHG